jgi:fructose-1,6-bisphosphatase I
MSDLSYEFEHGKIVTIERHILEEQRFYPEATGVLTNLLYDLALAGKIIASRTTRAGLVDILGATTEINVQDETVMRLDRLADQVIYRLNDHTGRLAIIASEENEQPMLIPDKYPSGKYVLLYDPLDGSSNIDYNASVGTIFAIYRRITPDGTPGTLEDLLQPGRDLVAAGYMIYGSSTMLVYTSGSGVHGFTLDPLIGEFLLSHPHIQIPQVPKYYSVNQGYQKYWSDGIQRFTHWLQGMEPDFEPLEKALSARYIGSLVGDFHRNLLSGGIFYYPADSSDPKKKGGKLRLLYEAVPLAFIAEQAGGYASDGRRRILDIEPESIHHRVPLFLGNRDLVEKAEEFIRLYD